MRSLSGLLSDIRVNSQGGVKLPTGGDSFQVSLKLKPASAQADLTILEELSSKIVSLGSADLVILVFNETLSSLETEQFQSRR